MNSKMKSTSAIALMLCLALLLTACGLVLNINGNKEEPASISENSTDEVEYVDNNDVAVTESYGAPELPYMEVEKTFSLDGYDFDGFSESGYTEWYYVSQDFEKIKDAVLEAYPQWNFVDCGMFNTVLEYLPISGYTYDLALASRSVVYDADDHSLIFYKDARTMNDHVMSDINAPEDVLTAAKAYAENKLFLSMADADADDYRIEYINRVGYDADMYEYNVELYCLNYELHYNAPEKFVLAGGSYIREDGWGLAGYASCTYLVFVETEGGLEYVGSVFSNDIPPDHSEFMGNVTDLLVDKGFVDEDYMPFSDPESIAAMVSFIENLQDFDWLTLSSGSASTSDERMEKLVALWEYVKTYSLTKEQYQNVMKGTKGIDGAYAEMYCVILGVLYNRNDTLFAECYNTLDLDLKAEILMFTAYGLNIPREELSEQFEERK